MRIGIYGGSFNPPHLGHRITAERAVKLCSLDKLLIIPTAHSPHKAGQELATAEDRLNMCRLLFDSDGFEVSDLEIKRGGKSYTVDTLWQLKEIYPDDELVLIVGSDMLLCFDKWYKYREILSMCSICAFPREDGISPAQLSDYAVNKLDISDDKLFIEHGKPYVMSSTDVREKTENGHDVAAFTGKAVADYIKGKNVYIPDCDRLDEFKTVIRKMLRDDRYIHSLGVADSAVMLARLYGEDEKRAYCAGILHDVTKHIEPDMHEKLVVQSGSYMTQQEKANPSVWHAMSGEAYLKLVLNIKDEEIISAVRYHTTGKAGMSLLEKIIYIADYISAERNYPDVDVMRTLAVQSLDEAALYALKYCIANLIKNGKIIHTDSVNYYNELIMKQKEDK